MDIRWIFHLNDRPATLVFFLIYLLNARFELDCVHFKLHLLLFIYSFNWHVLLKFLRGFIALIEPGSRCDRQRSMPSIVNTLLELGLILFLDVHTTVFDLVACLSPL